MPRALASILTIAVYLALAALGAFLSSRRAVRERGIPWLDGAQTAVLFFIILALGVRLGADGEVFSSLGTIGLSALVIAVLAMAGSVLGVTLVRRFVLRLDRFASAPREGEERSGDAPQGGGRLTLLIAAAVLAGLALGRWVLPEAVSDRSGTAVSAGLDVMLFLVGLDLGRRGDVLKNLRAAGVKTLLIPAAVAAGSVLAGALAGLLLPFGVRGCAAAAAGMGWYSLAPGLIAPYSLRLSAAAFLANILRELLSILLIPTIARRAGYIECVALPGAAAADTVLPVILRATGRHVTVYPFVSGLICSLLVPVLVPLLIAF